MLHKSEKVRAVGWVGRTLVTDEHMAYLRMTRADWEKIALRWFSDLVPVIKKGKEKAEDDDFIVEDDHDKDADKAYKPDGAGSDDDDEDDDNEYNVDVGADGHPLTQPESDIAAAKAMPPGPTTTQKGRTKAVLRLLDDGADES